MISEMMIPVVTVGNVMHAPVDIVDWSSSSVIKNGILVVVFWFIIIGSNRPPIVKIRVANFLEPVVVRVDIVLIMINEIVVVRVAIGHRIRDVVFVEDGRSPLVIENQVSHIKLWRII